MPDTLAHRKIFGILVPYFNSVVEPELESLRPRAVSNQTGRFSLDANVLEEVADVAGKLTTCGVEAFVIGLATDSFPDGLSLLRQGADDVAARTGLPVFTASHAAHAALAAFGVKRIAIVTPFDDDGNACVRSAFEAGGFDVVGMRGLACPSFDLIAHTPVDDIRRAFLDADSADAEALVQVGTGLPVLHLLDELESRFAKPVIASNAAAYWQALRGTGIDDRIGGAGRLLAEL